MALLSWILGGGAKAVAEGASGVVKTVWGDQAARDQHLSAEQVALLNQYAAEFAARAHRTWWDSAVDGINRLIRPALAIGAQGAFVWAVVDPVGFAETMQALQIVPEPLWVVWAGIFAFYFSGRILEQLPRAWKVEPQMIALARELARQRASRGEALSDDSTPGALADLDASWQPQDSAPPAALPQPAKPPIPESPTRKRAAKPASAAALRKAEREAERTVAATVWGEARGEPRAGQVAVAWVIKNRVARPAWWGRDWAGVCTAPQQFTCWWDDQAERVRSVDARSVGYEACLEVARQVMAGTVADPTHGADHYYADTIPTPKWARGRTPTARIGRHVFFRLGPDGKG